MALGTPGVTSVIPARGACGRKASVYQRIRLRGQLRFRSDGTSYPLHAWRGKRHLGDSETRPEVWTRRTTLSPLRQGQYAAQDRLKQVVPIPRTSCHVLAIGALALLGCPRAAEPPHAPSATAAGRGEIRIDPELARGPRVRFEAWILYGATLAEAAASTTRSGGYPAEVRARTILADRWNEKRGAGTADRYLDLLVEVRRSGFIVEYVLAFLGRPGWVVAPEDLGKLHLAPFRQWMAGHLGTEHRAGTRIVVVPAAAPAPIPGDALPSPSEIEPGRVPCSELESKLAAAIHAWDEEEAHLGRVPISGVSPEQRLAAVAWAARDDRARREGVEFVPAKVAGVFFVAGFCAFERGDFGAGEQWLRRAVRLSPGHAGFRAELAQTLIREKKLDEADAEVDAALEFTDSPCELGLLWRKRGYILFDRGRLADSFNAYARSLDFDPGSELAKKEMETIVSELRRTGNFNGAPLEAYTPPPPGSTAVIKCP